MNARRMPLAALLLFSFAAACGTGSPGSSGAASSPASAGPTMVASTTAPTVAATAVPASRPTPAATGVPALVESFTSGVHPVTLKYPRGWIVAAATEPWTFGTDQGSGNVDTLTSPSGEAFAVTSQVLPGGMTEADWFAAYLTGVPPHPECFPQRSEWTPVTIDGIKGGLHGGLPICEFTEAVVILQRRAYVFTGGFTTRRKDVFSRPLFDALLATVRLGG